MNKLEKYRDEVACPLEGEDSFYADPALIERDGFDKAIALDLPVKFAGWKEGCVQTSEKEYMGYRFFDKKEGKYVYRLSMGQLFDYWLNNIWEGV